MATAQMGEYARATMCPKRRISPLLFGKDAIDYQANKMRLKRQGQIVSDEEKYPNFGRLPGGSTCVSGSSCASTCPDVRLQQLAAAGKHHKEPRNRDADDDFWSESEEVWQEARTKTVSRQGATPTRPGRRQTRSS